MSVMARIQELSGEDNGAFEGPDFQGADETGDIEGMMKANPIPGQSLTQDPGSKLPFEQPPKYTDLQEFIDDTFLKLSDPDRLPQLFEVMNSGIPLEHIAQKLLMKSFQSGDITPDLLLSSIEPTIYMLISLATYGGVDATLYPEDDMMDASDEEKAEEDVFKRASRELLASEDTNEDDRITVDEVQAPTVQPKSLLARAKTAAEQVTSVTPVKQGA